MDNTSLKKPKTKSKLNTKIFRLVVIVAAIFTLLSPFDILPDPILVAGFIDDLVAVLYLVSESIRYFKGRK